MIKEDGLPSWVLPEWARDYLETCVLPADGREASGYWYGISFSKNFVRNLLSQYYREHPERDPAYVQALGDAIFVLEHYLEADFEKRYGYEWPEEKGPGYYRNRKSGGQ